MFSLIRGLGCRAKLLCAFAALLVGCGGGGGSAEVAPLPALPAPTISTAPASVQVVAGQSASFGVVATGLGVTYAWQRAGLAIAGAPATAAYTLPNTTLADNGARFRVVVSNSGGSVTSSEATLTVVAPSPPTISTQPASVSALVGGTVTFQVVATGDLPLTYQWRRGGLVIPGATSSAYSLTTALVDNNSRFSVTVTSNGLSVTSNEAVLSVAAVLVAPSVSQQPLAVSVVEGQPATFSATVGGTLPITYQWLRNGVEIPGARLESFEALPITYTRQLTALADTGALFSVRATNSTGEVTSQAAVLTVTPRP